MITDLSTTSQGISLPRREGLGIRPATAADIPFIDALQKQHAHQVGWMPHKQLEGKIAQNQVIVAEAVGSTQKAEGSPVPELSESLPSAYCPLPTPLGYCIGQDQYFKRDDVGIIYQLNVATGRQRELVGASLLKAQFERSAWGCKLYCCWCAQDIAANRFWEAMGFVPLAFRAGSEKKSRVHIFWQRRIRAGDVTTPYWFPAQTTGGSIREDRLVLPIPPGTHWADVMPRVLPGVERADVGGQRTGKTKALPGASRNKIPEPALGGGMWFTPPASEKKKPAKAKEPKRKRKNDPKLVAAARELRDRWLEQVNAGHLIGAGKYDVSRAIAGASAARAKALAA